MENNFRTTINWQNADIYKPDQYKEPIIYCNNENKLGILDNTITGCSFDDNWNINYERDWNQLKEYYNIKWWCYCYYIIPAE